MYQNWAELWGTYLVSENCLLVWENPLLHIKLLGADVRPQQSTWHTVGTSYTPLLVWLRATITVPLTLLLDMKVPMVLSSLPKFRRNFAVPLGGPFFLPSNLPQASNQDDHLYSQNYIKQIKVTAVGMSKKMMVYSLSRSCYRCGMVSMALNWT